MLSYCMSMLSRRQPLHARMVRTLGILGIFCVTLTACGGAPRVDEPLPEQGVAELLASFERMPSGVAHWQGRTFIAFPRWVEEGAYTVAEWTEDGLRAFPGDDANDMAAGPSALHSVNGLHVDRHGRLWMLDNGRVNFGPAQAGAPKVVVWDLARDEEAFRIVFSDTESPAAGSFVNDIAVDEDHGFAYVTESGIGGTPALLVIELATGAVRRVLEAHPSVLPDPDSALVVDGAPVSVSLGGVVQPWRVSVNAVALSPDASELYYGPTTGERVYAIITMALRDAALSDDARASAVRVAGPKPYSDGMAVDADGHWVFTDLERGAIVHGNSHGEVRVCAGEGMSFPVAVEPVEGGVLATSAPFHEMPLLHAGEDKRDAVFGLWMCHEEP